MPADIPARAPASVPLLPDPRFPDVRQVAFLMRGDGGEGAGIREGDIIVALTYADWKARYDGIKDRAMCVVRRFRESLKEVEVSLREARVSCPRVTLVAPSSSPYAAVELTSKHGETVVIEAIVDRTVKMFL